MGNSGLATFFTPEQRCSMSTKVRIEGVANHEAILRRELALAEEKEQLALTTPDGTVFDTWEGAVIHPERASSAKVEGEAKSLELRLKRRGARWNQRNAQRLASLVCVRP